MRSFLCSHGDLLDYCGTIITRIESSAEALSTRDCYTFSAFIPFPCGCEISATLAATEWYWLNAVFFIFI